jgi:hypothetical protein
METLAEQAGAAATTAEQSDIAPPLTGKKIGRRAIAPGCKTKLLPFHNGTAAFLF